MRPQKILDTDMISGLTNVFRDKGYEGASLNDLAEVTGLKKASLYHRFPNGKQEMAECVLNTIDQWVDDNIFHPLIDENKPAKLRLKDALKNIEILYDSGKNTCVLRAFSMHGGISLFQQQIKSGMDKWISAFNTLGSSLQLTSAESQQNAVQTLIELQGSLIVTKGLADTSIFKNTLKNIEKRYSKE
ncbi:TetR/AcrR family transcriptional regulator [Chryseobacterium indoltheticum]|uniref:TetR/AcrR family transcriptional regulator n=1 Tax=Chryseobacterium indoltheticum TaxID=254 RepID=UPI001912EF90|nr:TetR/AcrR family transcriptional regulator [Chryseobacterium indoltheticum]QQQ29015.1 TetR/AcrR family transcriptional regulator [Chryseobacterium indoltheticum]